MRSILLALIPLMSMACALGADLVGGDSDTGSDKKESEEGEDGPEGDYEGDNGDPGSGAGPASGNAASGQTGPTSGPTSGTGQGGDFPSGDACCIPSMTPGCGADPSVEQCVCANDDYCCTTAWDDQCVGEVDEFGCGFCGGGFGGGDPGQGGGDPGRRVLHAHRGPRLRRSGGGRLRLPDRRLLLLHRMGRPVRPGGAPLRLWDLLTEPSPSFVSRR